MFSRAPRQKVNAVATLGASSVLHIEHAPPPASGEAEREAAATQQHDLGSDASERVVKSEFVDLDAIAAAEDDEAAEDLRTPATRRASVRWAAASAAPPPRVCGA